MDTNSSGIWYTRNRRVSGYKIASFRNKAKGSPNFDKSVKNSAGHTRDESFQMYAKSVFKKSLITGLPQIANSRTWRRRIRKILILLFCLMGFLYQTGNFLQYFWTYPTVSYIEDSSPYEVVQPALTFCSNNQIRRQVYCEQNDSSCEIFDDHEKFCNSFPSYCIKNETYYGIPTVLDAYSNVFSTSWEEAIEFSPTEEMISTCRKITDSNFTFCSVRRFPVVSQRVNPTFCYTVESQINYPFSADVIYPNTFGNQMCCHSREELQEAFFNYTLLSNTQQWCPRKAFVTLSHFPASFPDLTPNDPMLPHFSQVGNLQIYLI
ncbi:uncharacterized protein [Parasteatoda tepidariorum]|uniref:uncharacterized protein n=1 Tax=Parasteatoda tepidariorum TaxID=114398 RepID=UPI0039BC8230